MKTKTLVTTGLIAAVTALSVACTGAADAMGRSYETLEKKDLRATISANGMVESVDSEKIYSSVNYPVKEVLAEVGDKVKAGDVLCIIDASDLESQIAVKEAAMQSANINTYYQLSQSEKQYNEAKNNLDNGMNVELANAEAMMKSAELELNNAKKKYADAQRSLDKSQDKSIMDLSDRLNMAEWNLKCAKDKYFELMNGDFSSQKDIAQKFEDKVSEAKNELTAAKNELNSAKTSDLGKISSASDKVKTAQENYDKALKNLFDNIRGELLYKRYEVEALDQESESLRDELNALLNGVGGEVAQYKNMLDNAQLNYDKAVLSYETTKLSVNQQLEKLKDAMERDQKTISNDAQLVELDALKKKLAECTVVSPVDGTVTAVNASVGAAAVGILFTVENIDSLKVTAGVKEYNIGEISVGQKVIIKTDATGDTEYEGEVTKIAPAATQAQTMSGSESTFAVEIKVNSADTKLLIGMSTRLKVVTEEKSSVYSVRYDAVTKDENGNDIIYVAEENGENGYTVRAIPVTLGMETDLEVEITSAELKDGMKILTDIDFLKPGQTVVLETK